MTDYSWNTAVSGDWSNAVDWQGGLPNDPTANVTIGVAGAYTVTVGVGESFTVGALTLDDSGGSLLVAGTLDLAGVMTLTAGALDLNGTIKGGTIADPNDALVASGGALDGVTYQGTLDLSQNFDRLDILDGLSVEGGVGAGTILDTGYQAALLAANTQTLNKVTIDLGNNFAAATLGVADATGAGVMLTLGPQTTIDQTGLDATLSGGFYTGDGIVNQGAIDADLSGGQFTIDARNFTNHGTITVTAGDTLDLAATNFTNTGAITVTGGKLILNATNFSSTGAFRAINDGTIDVQSNLTLAQLSTITDPSGALEIDGTLDLGAGTLNVGPGSALGTVTAKGTIEGGTIADAGNGLLLNGATLDDITYQGAILDDSSPTGFTLNVSHGLNFTNSTGKTNLNIYYTGGQDNAVLINAEDTETINGIDITQSFDTSLTIDADDPSGGAAALTLGPQSIITATDTDTIITAGSYSGDQVINQGVINAEVTTNSSGYFYVRPTLFYNKGTFIVSGSPSTYKGDGVVQFDVGTAIRGTNLYNSGSISLYYTIATFIGPILDNLGNLSVGSRSSINMDVEKFVNSGATNLDGGVFLFNNRHATDFINSGIINVGNYPGSAINPAAFDNTGSIVVGEGGALTLQPATFTNLSGTTLTGGVYEVEAGASLTLVKTATITTDDATIILSGASSTITGAATIDASLTTIGAHGALELLAGRSFSGSAAFTNSGSLVLGGGTFTESSLTNAAGAKISGQGSIVPAVANSGTVEASGGALILEGAVSGTGNLTVDAGATLTLGAAAASTQTVRFGAGTGAATLEVADAAAFAGRVAGFGAGDAMDFTGLAYSASETLRYVANSGNTGGTLTVIDGTNTAHIALFGQYMAAGFQKMQDSGTGTTVTYTPPAAITPELAPHH